MNVLFVGQNLQTGGIQTALINTLKTLSKEKKFDRIDLFLFAGGELEKEIPEDINVIYGNKILSLIATPFSKVIRGKKIIDIILRVALIIIVRIIGSKKLYNVAFKLNKKLDYYDIAISYFNDVPNNYFNQGTNQFVLEKVNANKMIAWIHTDPIIAKFDRIYCKKIYKDFNKIICVSKACKDKFSEFLPEYTEKTEVVYNMFPIEEIECKSKKFDIHNNISLVNIVTVARIDNNKRIDIIINICKRLNDNNIRNYKWIIVGDGPNIKENKLKIKEYNLEKYIQFIGNKENPYPYILNKDLFVLTSALEGYPMVIGESLILKTPVVTTEYAAAQEQIINNHNGFIVEMKEEKVYEKIRSLIENRIEIENLKKNLLQDKFSNEVALNQLFKVLEVYYE